MQSLATVAWYRRGRVLVLGMDIVSHNQALAESWSEIRYDADGLSANFVGLCPDCRRAQEERDSEKGLPQT